MHRDPRLIARRRAELGEHMVIDRLRDGYHVREVREVTKTWAGPFATEGGARLFLEDFLDAYAMEAPEEVAAVDGVEAAYDRWAQHTTEATTDPPARGGAWAMAEDEIEALLDAAAIANETDDPPEEVPKESDF